MCGSSIGFSPLDVADQNQGGECTFLNAAPNQTYNMNITPAIDVDEYFWQGSYPYTSAPHQIHSVYTGTKIILHTDGNFTSVPVKYFAVGY